MALTSIQLNDLGEQIAPYEGVENDDPATTPVGGTHLHCGGLLIRRSVTENEDVLACRECNFRVIIPNTVTYWSDLVTWETQQPWAV